VLALHSFMGQGMGQLSDDGRHIVIKGIGGHSIDVDASMGCKSGMCGDAGWENGCDAGWGCRDAWDAGFCMDVDVEHGCRMRMRGMWGMDSRAQCVGAQVWMCGMHEGMQDGDADAVGSMTPECMKRKQTPN